MPTPLRLQLPTDDPGNPLALYFQPYRNRLVAGRYGAKHNRRYVAALIHFGRWVAAEGIEVSTLTEAAVARFLGEHLPNCSCARPVQRDGIGNRAALNHLLRLLRELGVIAAPEEDEIARELARFDLKMAQVWGLSPGTRDHRRRIVRRLLKLRFGAGPIDISALSPADVRDFVLGDQGWSPSTIRVMGGAVRCYLRHRALDGDDLATLLRAVPRPAFWRESNLPETFSAGDLEQLFGAFGEGCPSRRRGYAMARCLADLGLRCSEVVRLELDDIDWRAGTIRVAAGKARRADVLPLPDTTGAAIVDYLLHERPKAGCRRIFVRHVAPLGEPVGRRVVQQALHAAYRRLGWDRTRIHVLRHMLGSRLINAGTPMKHIADVLRHRSIVTSATYTRVDVGRLTAVAMPWPGSVA
jgi:integrase/recombinase XerD